MMVIIFIVVIIIIVVAIAGQSKAATPTSTQSTVRQQYTEQKKQTTISPAPVKKMEGVTDVTGQVYTIPSQARLKKYLPGVPHWSHHYVYSHTELEAATAVQKRFYAVFKTAFLNGEYFDLEDNLNYAFILFYDLVNDYERQRDLLKLEKQLEILGRCYPKTKTYGTAYVLKQKPPNQQPQATYTYNEDYWNLGGRFKKELNLTDEDVKLLNKLWNPGNNFCSIHFCLREILKLFIRTMHALEQTYKEEGINTVEAFKKIADLIARKQFRYRAGSDNYKYTIESGVKEMYSNVFRFCENAVREQYGHKRKVGTELNYTNTEIRVAYESVIAARMPGILTALASGIAAPDEATEIELNLQNTTRWKTKFDEITALPGLSPSTFMEAIITLGRLNNKNPAVENIFYEASKFIAKTDKETALKLYVYYIYYDLKSNTFDNRQLNKTIQKSLFKTTEQLQDFENLISKLIKDKDLIKALKGVAAIYAIKRKKIQLDTEHIKEVQQQHAGTVELLNEYLADEEDASEVNIQITAPDAAATAPSAGYSSMLAFTTLHIETLDIFRKNNYCILQTELESFAKGKGVFKNQLVENINETCYETLDDVLIEEEDDHYIINPDYYQRLLAI